MAKFELEVNNLLAGKQIAKLWAKVITKSAENSSIEIKSTNNQAGPSNQVQFESILPGQSVSLQIDSRFFFTP